MDSACVGRRFLDINSPVGGNYAISTINCPLNDMRYNVFTSSTDTAGGVNIAFPGGGGIGFSSSSYIMYNTFHMNNSCARAIEVQSFGGITASTYINRNTMNSNGNATGIFLSTITGAVIKNNSISGFVTGIDMMSSSADLYGNTISTTDIESRGINEVESSCINMAPSGTIWLGGMNN